MTAPPTLAAKQAGLRYVSDDKPGISRKAKGDSFVYYMPGGALIKDKATLNRIRSLVIPPAWTEVWICPNQNGHIQATGRDARRRKQYRYHPRWNAASDASKYTRVLAFGAVLPRIRRRVAADLKSRGLSRQKVLAIIVRLLERTLIRVGNDEYAQQNGSYGLTTMHNRHAAVHGAQITFSFKGKSGKQHRIDIHDQRLAKLVRRCQELPGQDLFGYLDETGAVHGISSDDVNTYLHEIAGEEFSAKDFRTWAGTVLMAVALRQFDTFSSKTQAKQNIVQAIKAVAKMLGNTTSVCRRCYIHPAILDHYTAGRTIATLSSVAMKSSLGPLMTKLRSEEAAVMMLLRSAPVSKPL